MLRLYNTLTREKDAFKPIKKKEAGIYTCGPSVYDFAHIGNFRTFVFEDVLVRYLRYRGYKVRRIMNITDVEDKSISDALKAGKPLEEFIQPYMKRFFEDFKKLNLLPADVYPRASQTIPEMVGMIIRMMRRGFAYKAEDGAIYLDVSKFKNYGRLSRLKLRRGKRRIRRDEPSTIKADFALWKAYDKREGSVFWETEFGRGRPGWHIECSAIGYTYLGKHYDIIAGGVDNIFPHHENTIVQNLAAFGELPANYLLHSRHLIVDGRKMSKSLGNVYTLSDVLSRGYDTKAIKHVLLSAHYRGRLNFTLGKVEESKKAVERIERAIAKLERMRSGSINAEKLVLGAEKKFEAAMDDSLNTKKSLAIIDKFVRDMGRVADRLDKKSRKKALRAFEKFDSVLGFGFFTKK